MPRKKKEPAASPGSPPWTPVNDAVDTAGRAFGIPDAEQAMAQAFEQMRAGLLESHKDGRLAEAASPEHIAALIPLLVDHPDVAQGLFRSGFVACVTILHQVAQIVRATADPECGIPGHDHGSGTMSRVGRA
jgi:hypothetical protein